MRQLLSFLLVFALLTSCGKKATKEVWLDEMPLSTMEVGWGEAMPKKTVEGKTMTIAGKTYERGIGAHAYSEFEVDLKGVAQKFTAIVGVDDECKPYSGQGATLIFKLELDGKEIYNSGVMKFQDPAKQVDVDVSGGKVLKMIVDPTKDGSHGDHADWADVKLLVLDDAKELPAPLNTIDSVAAPYILTPVASDTPEINGADIYGARINSPFLYKVPATGKSPLKYSAIGLPSGLKINPQTGIITGSVAKEGTYNTRVIVSNSLGADTLKFDIVIGEELALTPPMGWNSWNVYGLSVSDKKIRDIADAIGIDCKQCPF